MEALLKGIPNLRIREKIRDDDSVDQLHHFVTVYMYVVFSIIIGIKEMAGQPLDCWVTLERFGHFQQHANSYCWANRMYKYPDPNDPSVVPYNLTSNGLAQDPVMARDVEDSDGLNIYRWVTVIFFFQAFLFKLPSLVWSVCNESSGTQIERMVSMLVDGTFKSHVERKALMGLLAEYIEIWLKISRKPSWFMRQKIALKSRQILHYCMLCVGGNKGNFLSSMYLIVKFWYLFNVMFQFIILSAFLEFDFWGYGPRAVQSLQTARLNRKYFPATGLCHFQVQSQGQWVQCILTINMLLEKIFLVQWFWLLFLFIITPISLFVWIYRTLHTDSSVRFVKRYLRLLRDEGYLHEGGDKTMKTFVMNYLGNDGIFILRILATNTNDVAMAELVTCMWKRFVNYEHKSEDKEDLRPAPVRDHDISFELKEMVDREGDGKDLV